MWSQKLVGQNIGLVIDFNNYCWCKSIIEKSRSRTISNSYREELNVKLKAQTFILRYIICNI